MRTNDAITRALLVAAKLPPEDARALRHVIEVARYASLLRGALEEMMVPSVDPAGLVASVLASTCRCGHGEAFHRSNVTGRIERCAVCACAQYEAGAG